MLEEFFPGEPCFRSIGYFKEENIRSTGAKMFTWAFKMLVKECLKNNKDNKLGKVSHLLLILLNK